MSGMHAALQKSLLEEDNDVSIPVEPSKRVRRDPPGGSASGAGKGGDGKEVGDGAAAGKEWWEVDDDEPEYVSVKKRRQDRTNQSAMRLGRKVVMPVRRESASERALLPTSRLLAA